MGIWSKTPQAEPLLTPEELHGLVRIVMRIDRTTQDIRWLPREEDDDDGEEEQDL
jgi:hypothetical protein